MLVTGSPNWQWCQMEVVSLTSPGMPCAQRDELQQLTVLARDAAEILFEMAAMQDKSPEAHDMLGKSQQIEVGSLQSLQLEHSAHQSCCFALLLLQGRSVVYADSEALCLDGVLCLAPHQSSTRHITWVC